jgi:subtilisin-like proprotein convertase family protein
MLPCITVFQRWSFRLLVLMAMVASLAGNAAASPGFVYALDQINGGANQIYGFRVNPSTGALTLLPGFPVASGGLGGAGSFSGHVAYDNGLLHVINEGSASLSVFVVNAATGGLTAAPFSPVALAGDLACVAASPTNSTVVVGSNTGMWGLVITPTTATVSAGSPVSTSGASPFGCAFSRDGSYAYTGGNVGSIIAGFAVNPSTAVLTPLGGSPFDTLAGNPVGYATDSAGRLFTSNFGTGVRAFTSSSGMLTAVAGNPFPSGLSGGVHGVLNPLGFYMVADRSANRVGVYQIAGSGAGTTLTAVAGSPFASGGSFTDAITTSTDGRIVVVANGISRNLTVFSANAGTGALTSLLVQPISSVGAAGLLTGIAFAPSVSATASTDFDGDGKGDLLLRNNSTGQNIGWLMNGLTVSNSAFMPTIADTNWEIKAVGDLDGDGKADVILRNKVTGQNIGWLMNGLTVSLSAFLPTIADTDWDIKGIGDFDGDGKADVILRNDSTGQNIGWLMNGLTVSASAFLPTIADTNWAIKTVSDFDGDGKADVAWRNKSTGQDIGWLMNGLAVSFSAFLPTIADTNWDFVPVRSDITFTASGPWTIPDSGQASTYPAVVTVSGLPSVKRLRVRLTGISHTFPDDLDILLVGPGGQTVLLMSDVGGSGDVTGLNLTLDDGAPAIPDAGPLVAGTFAPTNIGAGDAFPAPAPAGPYGATLSGFTGASPNGVWSLYVFDDAAGDPGSLGSFSLVFSPD